MWFFSWPSMIGDINKKIKWSTEMASKRYSKQIIKQKYNYTPKLVGYIRVSTDGQARDGKSLDSQREQIETYCKLHDIELVGICSDEGVSGTKDRTERPGLNQVLNVLEDGKAYGVVTPYFDRFGRGGHKTVSDVEYVTNELGCMFICLDLSMDTSSPAGMMMLQMMAATARLFRDQVSQKTKDVLKSKRDRGEVYSGIPMGYTREGDKLIENESEMFIIKRIKELRESGLSWGKIAIKLTEEGLKPKKSNKWHAYSCQSIYERICYA